MTADIRGKPSTGDLVIVSRGRRAGKTTAALAEAYVTIERLTAERNAAIRRVEQLLERLESTDNGLLAVTAKLDAAVARAEKAEALANVHAAAAHFAEQQ